MSLYPDAPNYSTPNYDSFGATIGNLANVFRQGQQQNQQRDISTAFKDGIPTDPVTGAPDYNKIMQVLAQKGDINAIQTLAGPALDQRQMQQAQTVSPLLAGGPGGPGGPAPPAGAPVPAIPRAPVANAPAPGGTPVGDLSGASQAFPSVQSIVSSIIPDPSKAGVLATNFAKALKVDPAAPMTQDQAAQAQRIIGAYMKRAGTTANGGDYADTQAGHESFIRAYAKSKGLDPEVVVKIAKAEGLGALSPKNPNSASSVDVGPDGKPFSFGDFQDNVRDGLGTEMRKAGVDPADPKQWQTTDKANIDYMADKGLAPWKGDAEVKQLAAGGGNIPPASAAAAISTRPPPNQVADNSAKPIGPQVPLPQGFTDPQQAILAMDREMARLSTNPMAAGQVAALKDWRDRIAASTGLMEVRPGETLIDPRTGKIAFQAGGGLLDSETISAMAQQYRSGDTSVMQNLGRGAQGAENIVRLRREIALQNQAAGTTGSDQAIANAEYQGTKAGERTLGTRQANIELAATEFKNVVPVVQKASAAVNRSNYPDLNRIVQFGEEKTGDPAVVAFGSGVNTLVNLYARAISPTGTPTVSDKDHAREILSKAWSQGQFDAAVGMMSQEIDAALNSPAKVREEMRKRFGGGDQAAGEDDAAKPAASAAAPGQAPKPDKDGWVTLPGGIRIREAQ